MSEPKLLRACAVALIATALALFVISLVTALSGVRGAGAYTVIALPFLLGAVALGMRAHRLETANAR